MGRVVVVGAVLPFTLYLALFFISTSNNYRPDITEHHLHMLKKITTEKTRVSDATETQHVNFKEQKISLPVHQYSASNSVTASGRHEGERSKLDIKIRNATNMADRLHKLVPTLSFPDQPDTSPLGRPPNIPKRFLIEEADFCHRHPSLQIIAYIHSSIDRSVQRNLIRTTWGNASAYDMGDASVTIGVVFMMGHARNDFEQGIIDQESRQYHDIVQGDYGEHYRLLTYKALAGLYWISQHCLHIPWTLHSDDDTHIDIFLYHKKLGQLSETSREKFICSVRNGTVLRYGRWKVRFEEYSANNYPAYCSGGIWFLQTKLIPRLLEASKFVPFLWVDDAYITGLVAGQTGIHHHSFQKYYGGPKLELENLGKEVAWFAKYVPHQVWWDAILRYHRNHLSS